MATHDGGKLQLMHIMTDLPPKCGSFIRRFDGEIDLKSTNFSASVGFPTEDNLISRLRKAQAALRRART
jgi:hypothetical protein